MLIVVDESLNVNKHNYYFHEDKMRECIEFEILQRVEYSLNNGDVLSIRSTVEEGLRQPALLVSFLKWFLTGVEKQIDGERGKHLDSVVRSLADTLLYNMKTKRQVDYLPQTDVSFKHTNENLHVIGMGLATRQFGRSKANVNLLHGYGVSISNTRALQIETSLADAVIDNMRLNQGVYIPHDLQFRTVSS